MIFSRENLRQEKRLEVLSGAKDYESGTAMRNSFVPFFVSMEICPRQFDLGKIGHTNSCFPLGNSHLPLGKMASIYSRMIYYIGSYRKDDVDCSENVVLKKRNNWFMIKKNTVRRRAPPFLYICQLPATHDYEMKLPHFTFSFVEDANE